MRLSFVVAVAVLTLSVAHPSRGQDSDLVAEEARLRSLRLPTDGPGLLAFFKARTTTSVEADRLAKLVEGLTDRDEEARTKAYQGLVGLGRLAVPALRAAANDPDTSSANALARQALEAIQGEQGNQVLILSARVLARRHPAGAAQALLGFLPFTDNEELLDELKRSLAVVGFDSEGKPDSAVLKALTDEQPARRAAAAEVLGTRGAEPRDALLKMLADPRGSVRLRAALALAQVKEPRAVTALVSVLSEVPPVLGRDAEEFLMSLAGEQAPKATLPLTVTAESAAQIKKVREEWEGWWKKSEGATLLDEFKKRTMTEARREQAMALIKRLADDNFKVRQAASEELQRMGVVVVPLLRKIVQGEGEAEMKERAKACLTEIEKVAPGSLSPVYARLVAFRKPEGAVEALLDFLPFVDEDVVGGEVQAALNALASQGGKNLPPLLAALKDKLGVRRAAAGEALASIGGAKELEEVRKLLKDSEPLVKLRAMMALIDAHDKDAVPLLIDSLPELPVELVVQADDLLARLAGEDSLPGQVGADVEARQKRRELWSAWWKEKGSKGSLATMLVRPGQERPLGYTLIISPNQQKIVEVGSDGKARWEINQLSNVWDAQFIGRSRVLILESGRNRITERTLRGDVLWELSYQNIYPTGMQRLSNGNILLVANNRIQEITRGGKEVSSFNRPNGDILHARKMRDGSIIYVTSSSTVHRVDSQGKEVKSWRVNSPSNQGCEILPNGNVIFPQQHSNRVFEYDPEGRQVWTGVVVQPTAVARLPSGNTLVGSSSPYQLVELDRGGKEVWKVTIPVQPLRILRR